MAYPGKPIWPSSKAIHLIFLLTGIPKLGYGQDYFTLRSIFFDGIPPPAIHLHLRIFNMPSRFRSHNEIPNGDGDTQDVPIGNLSNASAAGSPDPRAKRTVEVDIPPEEKYVFDKWLRELWEAKDEDMERFLDTGSFRHKGDSGEAPSVGIRLELRDKRDILDAFCFFWPATIGYLLSWLRG